MAAIPMKKWSTLRKVLFSIQKFKWGALIYAAVVVFHASRILYRIISPKRSNTICVICAVRRRKRNKTNRKRNRRYRRKNRFFGRLTAPYQVKISTPKHIFLKICTWSETGLSMSWNWQASFRLRKAEISLPAAPNTCTRRF